jgi:hypothetical protein
MYMADFDYNITYIRGKDNTAAYALSRMPDATPDACLVACAITYTCNAPVKGGWSLLRPHAGQSITRLYNAYMRYNWD